MSDEGRGTTSPFYSDWIFFTLVFLSACANNVEKTSGIDPGCDLSHCSAVAKPAPLRSVELEEPLYYLGPKFAFSLKENPKSVRYSPTSLIIERQEDGVLVAMAMTAEDLGLTEAEDIPVLEMFQWYFLKPYEQAKAGDLSPAVLENIKAFKLVFELGDVQRFRYLTNGPLTLVSFYSPEDSLHRLYAVSDEQPHIGYAIDLRNFSDEEVDTLLKHFTPM